MLDQVQALRAAIDQLHVRRELVALLQRLDAAHAEAFVGPQQVADPQHHDGLACEELRRPVVVHMDLLARERLAAGERRLRPTRVPVVSVGDQDVVVVPGLDRPPRAGAKAWEVCECNGRIFVWHHADGVPPSFDVIGYRPDESAWTPWRSSSYRVRVHVQDLTENIIDRSHFSTVHDMKPPELEHFEVRFSGASMVVDQRLSVTAVSEVGFEVSTTTTTCGPGIVAVEVSQDPIEMLTYITQTPIDDELTEVALCFSMKRLEDEAATESISELNDQVTNLQFTQDVPIWENKIYRERPIITKVDGPVAQYRRWFRQFYSNGNELLES